MRTAEERLKLQVETEDKANKILDGQPRLLLLVLRKQLDALEPRLHRGNIGDEIERELRK